MKNRELKFDNKNTIVNFSNSILKSFHCPTYHESIPEIDQILAHHKKVVVMLFDGLGRSIRKLHLNEHSSLQSHYVHTMEATYPPTTVASINGLLSGRFPIENGWLGWRQYYQDKKCIILVFKSKDADSDTYFKSQSGNLHMDLFGYESFLDTIHRLHPEIETNKIQCFPIDENGPKNDHFSHYYRLINKMLKGKESIVSYVYTNQPDDLIHGLGVQHKKVHRFIKRIDRFCARVAKKNKDTLFLVIADHGLVDVQMFHVYEHQDLIDTLRALPSIECRTTTFFVKEGQEELFQSLFKKYYGDKFILLTKKQVLDLHLFGEGNLQSGVEQFLGDYFAIANDVYSFELTKNPDPNRMIKAHHAGLSKEEMEIDISAYNI